jgi:hypothetical protein
MTIQPNLIALQLPTNEIEFSRFPVSHPLLRQRVKPNHLHQSIHSRHAYRRSRTDPS